MNRFWTGCAIALAIALPCFAQETTSRPHKERPAAGAKELRGELEKVGELLKDMTLTEPQRKQVDQILDTDRQAVGNWMKDHAEDLKAAKAKLEEAQKSGDKDQVREAREAIAKILATRADPHENLMKQLSEVLTKEQMDKVRAALPPRMEGKLDGLGANIERLGLDDKQREQVKAIMDPAREAAAKADGADAKRQILKDALEKIRTDVLTEDQRKKLESMKPNKEDGLASRPTTRAGKGEIFEALTQLREKLNFTDDQKSKIEDIVKATREAMKSAQGAEAKRAALKDGWKKIEDAMTPDQKALLEKWRSEHAGQALGDRLREGARKRGSATTAPPQ